MYFWDAMEVYRFENIQSVWKEYEVIWLKDQFEVQLELTEGKLIFPNFTYERLVDRVEKIVCAEIFDPEKSWKPVTEALEKKGKSVQVNPAISKAQSFNFSQQQRKELFSKLLRLTEGC